MKYVRPFDRASLAPGKAQTLIAAGEDVGCAIELRRGGDQAAAQESRDERFALVLSGEVRLATAKETVSAVEGDLIFIPAGTSAAVSGGQDAFWIAVSAPVQADKTGAPGVAHVIKIDPSRFEGAGFAYQSLIDRTAGAATMRMNVLQVQPGSGSPDYHIHAFAQLYVIQDGEMTIDIGRRRLTAGPDSLVILPQGVVHRNFNAGSAVERHVSLLVPEPAEGAIFDYAVTIHEQEAELLQQAPA